ncbi:MAG: hypothetical protein K0Q92_204 [Steroidobacteraceae bacterium]|jgi:hypothetical protein|nr:hypothetical protein [Steroidobacteraceae bacterium]
MNRGILIAGALLVCTATQAAEPTRPAAAAVAAPARLAAGNDAEPLPRKLDLRVGDVRKYMTPEEFRALLAGREEERNTVLVQANVPLLPVKSEQPIPSGMPLLPLWWAVTNPTQSWRILLPDLNAPPPGPPDKVPPPIFRWGP